MLNFKIWLENKIFQGIEPSDITWWSNYAANMKFPSELAAREWVFQRREYTDRQPSSTVFGVDGTEYNREFANAIPVYQSGAVFKIGKRIRKDNRLRLKNLEVRSPGWEYIIQTAQANGTEDFKVHKIKWIPIRFTVSDENDYYLVNQKTRIKDLADQIKTNGWIEAVIYDYKNLNILEGQHRARAMKVLGFSTVPGVGIEYEI